LRQVRRALATPYEAMRLVSRLADTVYTSLWNAQFGEPEAPAAKSGAASYEADKQAKREERNRQRRIEQLEALISKLEDEIAQLESELALPEVYQDYTAVQERQDEIDRRKEQLSSAYEEWEALAEG